MKKGIRLPGLPQFIMTFVLCACVISSTAFAAESQLTGDKIETSKGDLIIHPIEHATFAMSWNGKNILVDPVGRQASFQDLPHPDIILITDIHGDHLNAATTARLAGPNTVFVAPQAVTDKLSSKEQARTTTLPNGKSTTIEGIQIEAIPMYNLTESRKQYHTKGRGNGYVLTFGDKRVYISGDTEDIPEMRGLKNIDVAFVCMNLPYTMEVEKAANAVEEFKPKIVYPYHYRGSDIQKFKELVSKTPGIDVRLRDWYPKTAASK